MPLAIRPPIDPPENTVMNKRNILARTAIATLLLSTAFAAMAGLQSSLNVGISDELKSATGTMSGARYSADNTQFISCTNQNNTIGNCIAKDVAGLSRSCVTNDPGLIAVISSLGPDSMLTFKWDAQGVCTQVRVVNGSQFKP